jgi:multiple sugar transport system substrate-binding protein
MQVRAVILAAVLMLVPLSARAADLVIWWERGFNPAEEQAIRETVAAFERKTDKAVELTFQPQALFQPQPDGLLAALTKAGQPPDLLYNSDTWNIYAKWAYEGRLADLTDALAPLAAQFDQDALDHATLLDGTTGRRGLYALPMARGVEHIHVWRDLLEQVGFTLADIPKEWEPFWAFWCDTVQPAVRRTLGRSGRVSPRRCWRTSSWQFASLISDDRLTKGGVSGADARWRTHPQPLNAPVGTPRTTTSKPDQSLRVKP